MLDMKMMYDKMAYELEDLFKKGLTPQTVAIIDDITCAMRNIKKMEYWESDDGKNETKYNKEKHLSKYGISSDKEKEHPVKETYEKRGAVYGFCDDLEEYKSAKEHYNKCKSNSDITGASMWKEVAVGNLKSSLAQLDIALQDIISNTDTEEERVAVKETVKRIKDKINM